MITLRFVSHPGVFNWACSIAQYGYWPTHVETVMPDGRLLGAMRDGVKLRAANYDTGEFIREMIIHVNATPEQEAGYYAFILSQVGKPYDFWAIVNFYSKRSGRDWQADDSWFCSELVAAALAACKIFPNHLAVEFSRITPRDLLLLVGALAEAG